MSSALRRWLPCCCPPLITQRGVSIRLQEDVATPGIPAVPMTEAAGPPKQGSSRRLTVHNRRRAAVTSEKSEMLASARWHSAL